MGIVGICACYDTLNYGSMLQAFATQYSIEKLGYPSEFIVYKKRKDLAFYIKALPRILNATMFNDKLQKLQKRVSLELHPDVKRQNNVRRAAFKSFQENYYRAFSDPYEGYERLKEGAKRYESVVVGSDQLWLPAGLATNFYNLMFVPDEINKVSYATSFGVGRIPWYQVSRTREFLSRIDHLSVRELQGAEIVRSLTGRTALTVADPTMLLTREEWQNEIPDFKPVDGDYIFCYFLGTNPAHREIANELGRKTGMRLVTTPFLDSFVKTDLNFGDLRLFDVGPDGFVNLIRNARYVLTDSFHGSVFSIINQKKFVVLNRFSNDSFNSRNSRIDSLCESLAADSRRYRTDIMGTMTADIDYSAVAQRLDRIREQSLSYLGNALHGKQNRKG